MQTCPSTRVSPLRLAAVATAAGFVAFATLRTLQSVYSRPPKMPEPDIPTNPEDGPVWSLIKRVLYRHFYVVRKGDPLKKLQEWGVQFNYRPFIMKIFFRAHVVLSSPEDIEHVLLRADTKFQKASGYDLVRSVVGRVGLVAIGNKELHAMHRRIVMPIFSSQNVRGMANEILRVHALVMLGGLFDVILRGGEEDAAVNLSDHVFRMTLSAMGEAAFRASRSESIRVRQHFDAMMKFSRLNYFCPYFNSAAQRNARKMLKEISANLLDKNMQMRHMNSRRCVMDALIDELYVHLSMEDVLDHLVMFLFAGHDTTSHTMEFLFALLAAHPAVQDRLYEALEDLMPSTCTCPTAEELVECEYLEAVVKEALRMYPAAPIIYRDACEDVYMPSSGVVIPKGMTAVISLFTLHRNTHTYGDDVDTFRPERWLGEEGAALRKRCGRCGFIPFSCGTRSCIGQEFGFLELLIVVALLGRHLQMELLGDFPEARYNITMVMSHPVSVRIRARPGIDVSEVYERMNAVLDLSDEDSLTSSNASAAVSETLVKGLKECG
ncbi:putative mitochondrial cytochrome p450-like protein [Leptomonas pyrrhocoris]|uniref:Putative mitochondrial cytochrome p450-like protein n=1 Tax=Leptomonas pyrrhocoris TaxID=157538 RepID=A0A0N0VG67_LEPPY|nr:putative mitochondrial cytochrome p450-like protein [Leptomonas pyrrhocoris]KPA82424.1 putative mitochondrial cytochrome p450-like protein [Leptomonas pyrrhocoris]|eukprot:XP_015660863.1 putative mitochondrial cytochrome p450-like protein [Leptomonas pyrrhocoris]